MKTLKPIKVLCYTVIILALLNALPYIFVRLLALTNAVTVYSSPNTVDEYSLSENNKTTIKIATYNIAHGRGAKLGEKNWNGQSENERKERLLSIANFFKEHNLDIVVLNEVDFNADWSHNLNQADFIAKHAGYPFRVEQRNFDIFHPAFTLRFGNAILSKYPITSAQLIKHMPLSKIENITAGNHNSVIANIAISNDKTFSLVAVHLEVRDFTIRMENYNLIKELLLTSNKPTIIAGDFNSVKSQNASHVTLVDKLTAIKNIGFYPLNPFNKESFTFPSESPNRTIDWIFSSPSIDILHGQVLRKPWSDHLPVLVELKIHTRND